MKYFLAFLIPFLLIMNSCKDSDNPVSPPPSNSGGKITTGEIVNLTTETVGVGGGSIKIAKPGDPLDGMEITIPPNAYEQSKSFQITYAPIVKHQMGENFNPISPMISITNDGSFANHAIKIKIPIKLPANHFASGFFYNEEMQTLEPIPIIELSDSTILLVTFSLPSNKKLGKSAIDVATNLIISSVLESMLENGLVLSTGFEPGQDDWEFHNPNTYVYNYIINSVGMAASTIYYYYEKRLKENASPLYHKYDLVHDKSTNPPKLWQDNPRGIRLSSVLANEVTNVNGKELNLALNEQLSNPSLVWKFFIHGILVTGAPQIMGAVSDLYRRMMIVYKVNLSEKILYVADPAYPAEVKKISFQNGQFIPYDGNDKFVSLGVNAMVPWKKFSERYKEFEAGTIGNDIFPSYKLYKDNTSGTELTDGMTVTTPNLKIVCKSDKCESHIIYTDKLQPITIFDKEGNEIATEDSYGIASVSLNQGPNIIGIYIQGLKTDAVWGEYLDFKWITVNYISSTQPKLIITPNPLEGLKNKKYKFVATLEGAALPAKTKYIWGMDAHGTSITVYNNDTLEYKYTNTGTYPIQVSLYDSVTGNPIASGSSQAKIREAENNYEYLITSWLLNFSLFAPMTFNPPEVGYKISHEFKISTDYFNLGGQHDLAWDTNSFSMAYNYVKIVYINEKKDTAKLFVTGYFKGIISNEGQILTSFEAEEHQKDDSGFVRDQSIAIANVPINNCSPNGCSAVHEGPEVASYITNISISGSYKDRDTKKIINYSLVSVDYNSANKPKLSIAFVR